MNHRIAFLSLLAVGASACGSSGSGGRDGERILSLESDAACGDDPPATPSVTTLAGPLRSSVPRAVAAEADGIWFTDSQDETLSHLAADGVLTRFPAPFPSEDVPDAALAADGSLWFDIVTGDLVANLGRMTPDGEVTLFPIPSGAKASRLHARGNEIWFTAGENIGRVGADGSIVEIGVGAATGDITGGPNDSVWFTEPGANRIGRLAADGTVAHFDVPTLDSGLGAVALGPDASIWFTETNTGKIGRIDGSGAILEHDVVVAPATIHELTAGPDGRLWFTVRTGEPRHAQVGSISTCGNVALVDLPSVSDSVDFRPPVDVAPVPYGIAGGNDEIWLTARLEPFETGAILRVDLGDSMP
jgi:virginiamycin B lyase